MPTLQLRGNNFIEQKPVFLNSLVLFPCLLMAFLWAKILKNLNTCIMSKSHTFKNSVLKIY